MIETLKIVTETTIVTTTVTTIEEKYRVVAPEAMQEVYMSDSEDEGGKFLSFTFHFLYQFTSNFNNNNKKNIYGFIDIFVYVSKS